MIDPPDTATTSGAYLAMKGGELIFASFAFHRVDNLGVACQSGDGMGS
jgi:hypothetical protein